LVLLQEFITMHGHLNFKNSNSCAGTNAANIVDVSLKMAY